MDEYQMTIDDMQFAEMVAAQPGRSAFIDESGSFGFLIFSFIIRSHLEISILLYKQVPSIVLSLSPSYFIGNTASRSISLVITGGQTPHLEKSLLFLCIRMNTCKLTHTHTHTHTHRLLSCIAAHIH